MFQRLVWHIRLCVNQGDKVPDGNADAPNDEADALVTVMFANNFTFSTRTGPTMEGLGPLQAVLFGKGVNPSIRFFKQVENYLNVVVLDLYNDIFSEHEHAVLLQTDMKNKQDVLRVSLPEERRLESLAEIKKVVLPYIGRVTMNKKTSSSGSTSQIKFCSIMGAPWQLNQSCKTILMTEP